MPRQKSIIVDDNAILAAVRAAYAADCAEVAKDIARAQAAYDAIQSGEGGRYDAYVLLQGYQRVGAAILASGIHNDLARWWGRRPSPSERIRLQESVRRLEAGGLVERYRTCIRPTPKQEAATNA